MIDTAATLSIVKLFMNADPVVKGVLLLLLAASVWSWAVIIDKLWRLGAASRAAREHEARAAAARSPQELSASSSRSTPDFYKGLELVPIYLEQANGQVIRLGSARPIGNMTVDQKIPLAGLKEKPRRAMINYHSDVLATN